MGVKENIEGVVLSTKDLLQGKFLATCFTKEKGLITSLCYGKKHAFFQSAFPLVSMTIKAGSSDIFFVEESSFIRSFLSQNDYDALLYGAKMGKAILQSQFPHRKSQELYSLFIRYLEKVANFSMPMNLWLSFLLKLLSFEGIFSLQKSCHFCSKEAQAIEEGSSVCLSHATKSSFCFNANEWELLSILTYARQFSFLEDITPKEALKKKIENLFSLITENRIW